VTEDQVIKSVVVRVGDIRTEKTNGVVAPKQMCRAAVVTNTLIASTKTIELQAPLLRKRDRK
jgi:hypothetical protein